MRYVGGTRMYTRRFTDACLNDRNNKGTRHDVSVRNKDARVVHDADDRFITHPFIDSLAFDCSALFRTLYTAEATKGVSLLRPFLFLYLSRSSPSLSFSVTEIDDEQATTRKQGNGKRKRLRITRPETRISAARSRDFYANNVPRDSLRNTGQRTAPRFNLPPLVRNYAAEYNIS